MKIVVKSTKKSDFVDFFAVFRYTCLENGRITTPSVYIIIGILHREYDTVIAGIH